MFNPKIKPTHLLFIGAVVIIIIWGWIWLIPELQFRLLASKYKAVNLTEKSNCYSGWVSSDFSQTYESPNGYSLKYPSYLNLRKDFQRYEEKINHSIQYTEGFLENKTGLLNRLHISISLSSYQNSKVSPLLSSSKNKSLPCNLIPKANYRSGTFPSLFGGEPGYTTIAEIEFPSNKSNFTYINMECFDNQKNSICNLILPQILATLKFK